MTGRIWTTLSKVLILYPVISVSLESVGYN
jgi:hypothetical protein